jgi:hypothetical protein
MRLHTRETKAPYSLNMAGLLASRALVGLGQAWAIGEACDTCDTKAQTRSGLILIAGLLVDMRLKTKT